jgi:peroxiredoxin (alkyl hydroperoxide reductase subunit C)
MTGNVGGYVSLEDLIDEADIKEMQEMVKAFKG